MHGEHARIVHNAHAHTHTRMHANVYKTTVELWSKICSYIIYYIYWAHAHIQRQNV